MVSHSSHKALARVRFSAMRRFQKHGSVVKRLSRRAHNADILGSNPSGTTQFNKMKRKYRSIRMLNFCLFFVRIYDFLRLRLRGETILSQQYMICIDQMRSWNNLSPRWYIFKMIYTQSMIDDLKASQGMDYEQELLSLVQE